MIGTQIIKGQGLGNQLFCYVTARCIAADKQAEFGMVDAQIMLDSLKGTAKEAFLDIWVGKKAQLSDFERVYQEREERIYTGTCRHDMEHGCYIAGADKKVLEARDGTLLMGNLQAQEYLEKHRSELKAWLRVKPEYDSYEYTRDNLCVLNLRGGEYASEPALFLRKKYWLDAMHQMKKIRPDMEFIIVTDDTEAAKRLLPEIPAYHRSIDKDYVTVKNARYLILSNSSFACFPALTSETAQKIIAPKYWARHNVSDGYWASEQNIYDDFEYLDRKGKLWTAEECSEELAAYKEKQGSIAKRQEKPVGMKRKLYSLQAKCIRSGYYGERAVRSLIRRCRALGSRCM